MKEKSCKKKPLEDTLLNRAHIRSRREGDITGRQLLNPWRALRKHHGEHQPIWQLVPSKLALGELKPKERLTFVSDVLYSIYIWLYLSRGVGTSH